MDNFIIYLNSTSKNTLIFLQLGKNFGKVFQLVLFSALRHEGGGGNGIPFHRIGGKVHAGKVRDSRKTARGSIKKDIRNP